MRRPELLTTAGSLEEAKVLFAAGADAIAVGTQAYALRAPGNFDLTAIRELVEYAHQECDKKVYVLVNGILHHDALEELDTYSKACAEIGVDALVFGDPAVLMSVREVAPQMKLHWSTETTSTNYRTVAYWAKKGVKRAVLARELSMDEMITTKKQSEIEIQIQVHGATCIFHSKRELVQSYLHYHGDDLDKHEGQLFLREHTRDKQVYPIWQDNHGTHVLSHEDICLIEHLAPYMEVGVDSFFLDGFMKSLDYQEVVVRAYRQAIDRLMADPTATDHSELLAQIKAIQPHNRPLGTGFTFKEQIY